MNPLDPTLMKAWNKGREAGKREAIEEFNLFLMNKMGTITDIPGIGKKTAWKIHEHFIQEIKNG